jgi:ribosomal protein S18 acetylase RimI-like enzyme
MKEINIRNATTDDLRQLAILFDQYRVFYKYQSDPGAAFSFLLDRLKRNESEMFVAEMKDGQLAGFVQLYPLFSSTRMKKLWLLNDLFVDPLFRGRQISIMLIDRAKVFVNETNALGLVLETAKSNDIGNSLYVKTGFLLDLDHNYYSWTNV